MNPKRTYASRKRASGSHATWSPGDSRVCCHCHKPIRITVDNAWIHTDHVTGEHRSSHIRCGSPLDQPAK